MGITVINRQDDENPLEKRKQEVLSSGIPIVGKTEPSVIKSIREEALHFLLKKCPELDWKVKTLGLMNKHGKLDYKYFIIGSKRLGAHSHFEMVSETSAFNEFTINPKKMATRFAMAGGIIYRAFLKFREHIDVHHGIEQATTIGEKAREVGIDIKTGNDIKIKE